MSTRRSSHSHTLTNTCLRMGAFILNISETSLSGSVRVSVRKKSDTLPLVSMEILPDAPITTLHYSALKVVPVEQLDMEIARAPRVRL